MGLLKDIYKNLVKSADKSAKKGGRSTQRKKKRESKPRDKGTRGTGSNRSSGGGSGGSSTRPSTTSSSGGGRSGGSSGSSRSSGTSTNRSTTTRPGTRSGAIRPVGKAGIMGGNTSTKEKPKITVNGKAVRPVGKAGVMGNSSSGKTTAKGQAKEIKTAGKVIYGAGKYTAQRWAGYATKAAGALSEQAYNKQNTGRKAGQVTPTRSGDRATVGQQKIADKRKEQQAKITARNNSAEFKKGREEYTKPFKSATKKIETAKGRTLEKATEDFSDKKKYQAPKWAQKFVGDQKFSAKDIAKGGIEMSSEMVDYMVPYIGTSGKFIKGAEKAVRAVKGGKMLTQTAKTGAKELTKDGQKAVSEIAARMVKEGKAPNEAIKAATKKVMRSDRATNIQKELLANAMQDATIGTTLDAAKGKEQGLKGKEFRNYMLQNAAMNAVFGGVASGVAGRTTRAGKRAIKEGIADSINKGSGLNKIEAREFINLQMIKDSAKGNANLKGGTSASGLSKEQQTRYNDLLKKSQNTDEVVRVNDKGKVVAVDTQATDVLSPAQKKEYFNLKAQEKAGAITTKNKARLQELDTQVKTAQRVVDANANEVLKYGGKKGVKIDRDTLERTVKHFENTGDEAKLKKAQKLLDDDIKAATKRSEDTVKAIDSIGRTTGMNYKLATADEIAQITGGKASKDELVNGFVHTNEKGELEVIVNKESPQAAQTIIGHETAHVIKSNSPEEFEKLGESLRDYARKIGEYDEFEAMMKRNYPELDEAGLNEEITSELVGRYIFGENNDFIKRLAGEKPNLARRIIEYVKDLMRKIENPELAAQLKSMSDEVERLVGDVKSGANDFSYDTLSRKTAKVVEASDEPVPKLATGQLDRKKIRKIAKQNALSKNNSHNTETQIFVKNLDQSEDIRIENDGLNHGLTRSDVESSMDTAKAEMHIGDVVENGVMVNRLSPRPGAIETQLFVGAVKDGDNILVVRYIVDKTDARGFAVNPSELEVIYRLDSAKAKKIAEPVDGGGAEPLPISASATVSVSDLLNAVKNTYPDTLSDDVLKHFGSSKDAVKKQFGKQKNLATQTLYSKTKKPADAGSFDGDKREFMPEVEARSDEIIKRIDEISRDLGGGRVTKENADEALKSIEAQRASDETVVRNNEDVIKNSDDAEAGLERPTPDSAEMPKGLKANLKASRPIKDRVQKELAGDGHDFSKADKRDIDKTFENITNRWANGDEAGARAEAEELVDKHFHFETEEKTPNPDYQKKRAELKEIQNYLKTHAWEMPAGSAKSLDEFLEFIGLPKSATKKLPIRKWSKKDSTMGLKGAHRGVIDKGGKTPRVQIDDQWDELSNLYPDYFSPELSGRPEEQFRALAEAALSKPDELFPEYTARALDDAEIKEFKQYTVDNILDLAKENAGTYREIDEPKPLKSIDDMSPEQLEKHLESEKKYHLKRAIEKYGEDSPRVKEIKDYIAKGEEKLAEIQGTKLAESKPVKSKPKSETTEPEKKPRGYDEVANDKDVGILPDAEVEAAKARYEAQRPNGIDAKPKRQLPTGIQKLADAKDSVVRQWVSSLYGIEKEAMKAGDKQLLNQTTKVYLTRNKLSAFIQQKRTNLDGKLTGDGLDAIYEKAGLFGKKNKEKKADFTNYLLYKHAIDRLDAGKPVHMGEDGASLYTKEQYQELIDDIAGKYKERGELGQLEQFEKGMRGYYDNLMQYRVDAGLVTKDFADALKERYPNYVPTYREGDDWMEGVMSNGESYQANIGQTVGVATGGREPIEDLYSQTVKRTEDVLKNAEENVMMNMFARAKGLGPGAIPRGATLEEVSEAAISVHKGHDGGWRVTFFQDGEPVTMACDKIVAQGLKEFNGTDFSTMMNAFTKMSSNKVTNTIGTNIKHLITDWNIMFGIRNGARDFQQALVNSKNTRAYCKSIPQAYASIARSMTGQESAYMKLYQANGGRYSALVRQDKKFVEPGMEKIPKGLKAPIRVLEAANSAIEMGPRMCEFIGTLNKRANDILKKDGSSVKQLRKEMMEDMYPGKTAKQLTADEIDEFEEKVANRIVDLCGKDAVDEAMRNSADITLNFSRTGVMGKTLNSGLVPYLNPSLQGPSKTIRLFTEGRADKALLNLGMKLGTFTIAPAVLNEVLMKDNRDYQNLNTREKDSNFFISIGDGKFIKVPKPRENAVLAEPVEYGLRYFFDKAQVGVIEKGEYSGEKMFQMWDSAWDNIGPVNPLTDNIISPLARLWQNKTWYGGSIDSISDTIALRDGETKHSEVFDEKTSALAIEIGNKKFGGKTISDRFKLSPKKIDDLMDSYLGMIYDLGVLSLDKTKPEVGSGNPFVNQFVKDSVFSNKTGTELWEEFAKLNTPKTTGGKILQAGKDAVLGNNKYNITDKTVEAQDWLNQKGYDDMTYSSAVLHFQTSKDFMGKKKEDLIRNAKIAQNTFRHDLAYGDGIVTPKMDPIRKLAGMVGVDYAMEKLTYTYVDPETGEKKNQHLDAWKAYKKSDEYKNDPKKADGKFIDFYSKMRWTNGLIGENKSYPSWMTASVLAATEKGKNDDLAKAYIRPDFDEDGEYTKKIIQRGKNYRDYGFTQGYYRKSQRTLFKAGRALEYEYTNKMNPWDKAMALSTAKKNYADGAYYSADTDGKVSRRMNYARYLNKTDHTTKEIYDFADKYNLELPKFDYENTTAKERGEGWRAFNKKVETAVNKEYKDATDAVKAAVYHVITDDTYNKPFGDIPDMAQKNDTGITELDERENKGGGGRRRRGRRGRRGRGGGGGGSGGGTMPTTESGAIKASVTKHTPTKAKATKIGKVTDPFKGSISNVSTKSNLDDAYRKRLRKLRDQSRKKH